MTINRLIGAPVLAILTFLVLAAPALAADWVAVKLRGSVLTLYEGAWQPLVRGATVPDPRVVRSGPNGRVQLRRGEEVLDLAPNTQIWIVENNNGDYTVVEQYFGEVHVQAEKRNVKHFVVQTPYLAAVVKGTRFVVKADAAGASVSVSEGLVHVMDMTRKMSVNVRPGQSAGAGRSASLSISGEGALAPLEALDNEDMPEDLLVLMERAVSASANANDNAGAGNNNAGGNGNNANAGGNENNANAGAGNNNAGGNSDGNGNSENSNAGGKNK